MGHLYTILHNRLYRGEIHHKGQIYAGDHEPIIDQASWDKAQSRLASNAAVRRSRKSSKEPSLLASLLFDGMGNRMTPSHAVKSGKRYRYYISNNLIAGANQGRESGSGDGLRLSAPEIEGHVVTAIAMFLSDSQRVIAELCPGGTLPALAGAAMRRAASFSQELNTGGGKECYETIRATVARVQVGDNAICVSLRRRSLVERLDMPIDATSQESDASLELNIPAELRRIGKEKRLIVAALVPKTNPNTPLIKAIVRAHQWFDMLKNRTVESITDIAKTERLPRTYISSVIPFALLAPDITSAILDGTQPVDLNLDRLINVTLPLDWSAQRSVFGFK